MEYMETNGFLLLKDGLTKLQELKDAGLNRILLSISPFHNEFISVQHIKQIFKDIISIFGNDGIFPWNHSYLYFLERVSQDKPVKLEEYFSNFSFPEILFQLSNIMYIHPGGRAAYLLSKYQDLYPAEDLLDIECNRNLSSPTHAHIDYRGNYITGFCSGLRIGEESALNLKKLYKEGIDLREYPVLSMLTTGGLKKLYHFSLKEGYSPKKEGYVFPCHLCLDMRIYLYFNKEKYRDLYPDFFYEELKRDW